MMFLPYIGLRDNNIRKWMSEQPIGTVVIAQIGEGDHYRWVIHKKKDIGWWVYVDVLPNNWLVT